MAREGFKSYYTPNKEESFSTLLKENLFPDNYHTVTGIHKNHVWIEEDELGPIISIPHSRKNKECEYDVAEEICVEKWIVRDLRYKTGVYLVDVENDGHTWSTDREIAKKFSSYDQANAYATQCAKCYADGAFQVVRY